ncbi:MAG: hypothetical protein JSV88_00035 [Candidatus Aminicenantes bacterium]|nr:MAG: hypothetical protein JSV88_00035 [Candidatus Aminicenantes bacterium]
MDMRKILKLIMIISMMLGITLSILNFISVDSMAKLPGKGGGYQGTLQPDGCYGEPLNC